MRVDALNTAGIGSICSTSSLNREQEKPTPFYHGTRECPGSKLLTKSGDLIKQMYYECPSQNTTSFYNFFKELIG